MMNGQRLCAALAFGLAGSLLWMAYFSPTGVALWPLLVWVVGLCIVTGVALLKDRL